MGSAKSRRVVTALVVFICLAAVVDWFLVPQIQSRGKGLFTAILAGSAFAALGTWFLLFIGYQVVRLFKKR